MQRDDANPSRSPTSGSPTSVTRRATADGTSTTLGAHSSNTPLRRQNKLFFLLRRLYLEELRTQELSAGDRPNGTGDTALATTNAALTEAEKAWRALSAEERELYRQPEEAREMHLARLAQEHPEIQ